MSVVIDSSMALAYAFTEERTPAVYELVHRVNRNGGFVPSLWHLEVANVLHLAVRRGRITAQDRDGSLADLALLPLSVDGETDLRAGSSTLRLADQHRLTLYDAAYLELAVRRNLPLASLDQALRGAAETAGVEVL